MGGSAKPRRLQVLILSDDRRTLRHLSRFLGALAYDVRQVTAVEHAVAVLQCRPPDFLIVDSEAIARSGRDLSRLAGQPTALTRAFTFLILDKPDLEVVTQAIEAGIDDFLAKPIVYAELLVRLRAGARVLEFERRLRDQADVDPHTGLPNRHVLEERIRKELAQPSPDRNPPACALIDVDFLGQINDARGWAAGDRVIRAVAGDLFPLCSSPHLLASLGGGRFAALLADTTVEGAAQWAERAAGLVADAEIDLDGEPMRATASFGVAAPADDDRSPDALLERAERALVMAKHSGRNCVATYGQFDEESALWADLAAPGKMFERTVARDVMQPCTLVLRARQTVEQAAAMFHRTGLGELPVVDNDGRVVGIVTEEAVLDQPSGEASYARVAEIMDPDVAAYDEDTPLATLIEFLTQGSQSLAVIVSGGRPTGIVSSSGLAVLSEPLNAETFAHVGRYSAGSEYLLVRDL